ncbi:hypothetical protein [Desulfovibrio sp. JC010]|uniref:hypothetical protein n=1 Tax=Desulfovibrio sp. JC010 TaxID=2593641 RepID=UPI0013CFA2C6|nr:hypothetical protein [Desulfovibrio sp. JC010]NDV28921.1 hypothetical protein [Desulfovibrio sp. JC010]
MKRFLLILVLCLVCASCARIERYTTPFDTGGKVYKLALLPWQTTTMDFDFKYRWRMTQSVLKACKQAGTFEFKWSAYAVNGGDVDLLENIQKSGLWELRKYGKQYPVVPEVQAVLSGLDADLALLYDISADNYTRDPDFAYESRCDYVRIFLVDVKTGQVFTEFVRTNFMNGGLDADVKLLTLRAFNKFLADK